MPNVNPTGVAAQKSGTVTAPSGPITWTASPSGTVNASGGGQQLNSTGTDASDGSSTRHTECSMVGQPPYLTIDYSLDNTKRQAQVTLKSATSQLTLAVSNVNVMVTSGTATVSGSMQGSAVNWQGPVDLTSNPLVAGAVPGWPKGAFTAELQRAALFAPVEKALAPPSPIPVATGGIPKHMDDAYGVAGRAGAWCVGGAMAGGATTGPLAPVGAFWGCVGGATASLLNDWVSAIEGEVQPTAPVPPPGILDGSLPEPVGPVVTYSHDDPPPPPPSGGDPDYPPAPGGSTDPGAGAGGSGDDDGGGGGSGEGVDDKPGLQPK